MEDNFSFRRDVRAERIALSHFDDEVRQEAIRLHFRQRVVLLAETLEEPIKEFEAADDDRGVCVLEAECEPLQNEIQLRLACYETVLVLERKIFQS